MGREKISRVKVPQPRDTTCSHGSFGVWRIGWGRVRGCSGRVRPAPPHPPRNVWPDPWKTLKKMKTISLWCCIFWYLHAWRKSEIFLAKRIQELAKWFEQNVSREVDFERNDSLIGSPMWSWGGVWAVYYSSGLQFDGEKYCLLIPRNSPSANYYFFLEFQHNYSAVNFLSASKCQRSHQILTPVAYCIMTQQICELKHSS